MLRSRLRRGLASVLLVASAGCTSWHTTMAPLPEVVSKHPDRIRVTRRDSGRIEVRHPVVVSDTLRGVHDDRLVAIPVEDVLRVEARGASIAKYGVLAGVLIVAATAALLVVLIGAMTSW